MEMTDIEALLILLDAIHGVHPYPSEVFPLIKTGFDPRQLWGKKSDDARQIVKQWREIYEKIKETEA